MPIPDNDNGQSSQGGLSKKKTKPMVSSAAAPMDVIFSVAQTGCQTVKATTGCRRRCFVDVVLSASDEELFG